MTRNLSTAKSKKQKDLILYSLGADFIINYKENPDYTKLVLEFTQNKGVDIILDPVGKQNFDYVNYTSI